MKEYNLKLGDKINAELKEAAQRLHIEPEEALRRAVLLLNLATKAEKIELHNGEDVQEIILNPEEA